MRAFVAVGSNLGDRWGYLALAARELSALGGVSIVGKSRVYENEALGEPDQPRYLNAVLELETELTPGALLAALQRVEQLARRQREVRWGPRTLDLDLLLYDEAVINLPELTVPHPGVGSRRFVLAPLAELSPDRTVPGTGATVAELLRRAPAHDLRLVGSYPL
jgi:2-amino-4-hydroxy-6-hydroxymethyldihydropteridine diphosphokinase